MLIDKNSDGWKELMLTMQKMKEEKEQMAKSEDLGDRLFYRIFYARSKSDQEFLELAGQVREYLRGNYPEEKKARLRPYAEMFAMTTEAMNPEA